MLITDKSGHVELEDSSVNHAFITNEGPGTALDIKVQILPSGNARLASGQPFVIQRKPALGVDANPLDIHLSWDPQHEPNYSADITVAYKGIFGAQYERSYELRYSDNSLKLIHLPDKDKLVLPSATV